MADSRAVLRIQQLVGVLRVLLGLAFASLLVAQVRALPAMYDDWVRDSSELVGSGWLLIVAVLVLACVQLVIVCTWRLLTMVEQDRIFSEQSLIWVNIIVGSMAAAWALLLCVFGYAVRPGGPSVVFTTALLLMLVVGAVAGLLMVVMRALLRQATALRTEMETVV